MKTLSTQHCRFSVCLNGNLKWKGHFRSNYFKWRFTLLDILHSMPLWIRFRRFLVVVWQLYTPRQIQIHFQLIFWHRKRLLQRKELELIQHHTINDLKYILRTSNFAQNSLKIQAFLKKWDFKTFLALGNTTVAIWSIIVAFKSVSGFIILKFISCRNCIAGFTIDCGLVTMIHSVAFGTVLVGTASSIVTGLHWFRKGHMGSTSVNSFQWSQTYSSIASSGSPTPGRLAISWQ